MESCTASLTTAQNPHPHHTDMGFGRDKDDMTNDENWYPSLKKGSTYSFRRKLIYFTKRCLCLWMTFPGVESFIFSPVHHDLSCFTFSVFCEGLRFKRKRTLVPGRKVGWSEGGAQFHSWHEPLTYAGSTDNALSSAISFQVPCFIRFSTNAPGN